MDGHFEIRVLIVSANPLARIGLVTLLESVSGCEVVGQVAGDAALLQAVERLNPDALLWDMGWDTSASLESLNDLTASDLLPPVVALLANPDDFAETQAAGAMGLLLQEHTASEPLVAALVAAAQGLIVIDPALISQMQSSVPTESLEPDRTLTPRENEVLQLLAEGLPNKVIAARLGVSEHTIKFHINAIFSKLSVQSRTEAVVRATRLGLIIL